MSMDKTALPTYTSCLLLLLDKRNQKNMRRILWKGCGITAAIVFLLMHVQGLLVRADPQNDPSTERTTHTKSALHAADAPLSTETLYQKVLPSTMTLIVNKKDGKTYYGTAFMAIKKGMAVTAWHVVDGAQTVTAKFSDGEQFDVSGVVDRDEKRDVALIHLKVFGRPLVPLSPVDPNVGSKAFAIGAPEGLEFSLSDGIISQIRTVDGVKLLQFTSAISHGNSGGPLLDANGAGVGIVDGQLNDGQNLNFAVPSTYVLALDPTLPAQAWDTVKNAVLTSAIASADSYADAAKNKIFDRVLALSIMDVNDIKVVVTAISGETMDSESGYKSGLPAFFYGVVQNATIHCEQMKAIIPNDDQRAELKKYMLERLSILLDGCALTEKAIATAQTDQGWDNSASDLKDRAIALFILEQPSIPKEDWVDVKKSKSFLDTLPRDERIRIGCDDDPTGFTLGIYAFSGAPLAIVRTVKGHLASKMGLEAGDTVIGTGAQKFVDRQDFKIFLLDHQGQKVTIQVNRDAITQNIDLNIPSNLKAP